MPSPASGSCNCATTRVTCGTRFSARTVSELSRRRLIRRYGSGTRNCGQLVAVLRGHTADVHAAAFAAHSSLLVSVASDGEARVWDMKLAERNGILRGHDGFVYDVAFSPDGTQVASAAWDGTARVWDVTTGRQSAVLQHEQRKRDDKIVGSVAWHPDGKQLATATRADTITLWDLGSGKPLQVFKAPTGEWNGETRAVFNSCGHAAGLGESRRLHTSLGCGHRGAGGCVARTRGFCSRRRIQPRTGTQLASVGYDRTVRLWDLAKRSAVTILPGDAEGYRIAYDADGRLVAASSRGGNVRLWNAHTHQELSCLAAREPGVRPGVQSRRHASGDGVQ